MNVQYSVLSVEAAAKHQGPKRNTSAVFGLEGQPLSSGAGAAESREPFELFEPSTTPQVLVT